LGKVFFSLGAAKGKRPEGGGSGGQVRGAIRGVERLLLEEESGTRIGERWIGVGGERSLLRDGEVLGNSRREHHAMPPNYLIRRPRN